MAEAGIAVPNSAAFNAESQLMHQDPFHAVVERFKSFLENLIEKYENSDFSAVHQNEFENGQEAHCEGIQKSEPANFSSQDLIKLGIELNTLRNGPGIAAAPPDLVLSLLPILDKQVRRGLALEVDLDEEEIPEYTLSGLHEALDASLGLLGLIVAEDVDKKVLVEEYIENCILLCKQILQRNVFPVLDPSSDAASVLARKKKTRKDSDDVLDEPAANGKAKKGKKGSGKNGKGKKAGSKFAQMTKQLSKLRRSVVS